MSETQINLGKIETAGDVVEYDNDTPTLEDQARAKGWVPQEEWDGDPAQWADAKEFMFRGELMERIQRESKQNKSLQRKLEEMNKTLADMKEYQASIAKTEYKRALQALKHERSEAMANMDHESIAEIEDRIESLKEQDPSKYEAPKVERQGPQIPIEFQNAVKEWTLSTDYFDDPAFKKKADTAAALLLNSPDAEIYFNDPESFIEEVERRVKSPKRRKAVLDPDSTTANARTTKKFTEKHLNAKQREVAARFVKNGVVASMQEYVDQLADMNELDVQKGSR